MERMTCGIAELKFTDGNAGEMTFGGYGSVFGNVDAQDDVIARGAFKESIRDAKKTGQWPAMLLQHGGFWSASDLMPAGVWTEMEEDDIGLRLQGKLADTDRGREAYTLLKMQPRPALNGLSIGYRPKEVALRTKPEEPRRTIKKVELIEVSLVTFPANPKARVQSIKAIEEFKSLGDVERYLRDSYGVSRSEAVALVSRIKGLGQSDSDGDDLEAVVAALRRRAPALP